MAMKKKPGRSKVEVGIPSTEAVFSAGNNNASGSLIANLATQNRAELAYELREIALQDIELNPDNAIFRQLDTDEDVETLANDIDRNGLMHNLVVYPRTDGKQTKYVLLSGERRYKALNYLQARGDAKWNTVKNCRVVTTPLSDNEKKVMLLSANLQVRGGFANEMIRRKAVAELVSCLQAEPYNLTAAEAKKAIKEATPINGRQIDKDLSIEKNLNEGLKDLLDRGFVLRSEAESFLRMTPEEQRIAAQMLQQLYAIAYNGPGSAAIQDEKKAIRGRFVDALRTVADTSSMQDAHEALVAAVFTVQKEMACLKETIRKVKTIPPEQPAAPRDATRAEKEEIVYLDLSDLHPFKDHPFGVRDDAEMKSLVESVRNGGVNQPALVRPREGGGYEIIAGHRRQMASQLAGYRNMPCIVRNMTDDEAILAMTDDNLRQRETILPSEKAMSLKMQYEAIKHQGARGDSAEAGKLSLESVGQRNGMSVKTVQRYIWLNDLVPELKQTMDDGKLSFTPAVEISRVRPKHQKYIAVSIEGQQASPSKGQAKRLRELDKENKLSPDVIDGILCEEKKKEDRDVIITGAELEKFFGKEATPRQMKDQIMTLLEDWKERQPPELAKPDKKMDMEK